MDQLVTTMERKFFYRDGMRGALKITLASVVLNIVLASGLFYSVSHQPQPKYFATNNAGGIIQIRPLSVPIVGRQALANWAVNAVTASYTYDFVNYRKQLSELEQYFTKDGHEAFLDKLDSSGTIEAVTQNRMVVSSVVAGAPVVDAAESVNGIYTWKITVPIQVTYNGAKDSGIRKKNVTLVIKRASTLEKEQGLAIDQLVEAGA